MSWDGLKGKDAKVVQTIQKAQEMLPTNAKLDVVLAHFSHVEFIQDSELSDEFFEVHPGARLLTLPGWDIPKEFHEATREAVASFSCVMYADRVKQWEFHEAMIQ
eukprot:scaffold5193_cov32-Prasinocladus_malaysianus.AAC.1